MATPLLDVSNLVARYGGVQALNGVSFALDEGEVGLIVGANGAGKSTLLRCLVGNQPVHSGSVTLDGRDVSRVKAHQRAKLGIAWIPEGRGIIGELTVAENLDLARFGHAWRPEHRAASLRRFPILERAIGRPAGTLSGGEQQMLAIARAVETGARLLLVDEPSLGLAPIIVDEVMDHLRALGEEGHTILLVEQRTAQVGEIADKVLLLQRGNIAAADENLVFAEMDFETYAGGQAPSRDGSLS